MKPILDEADSKDLGMAVSAQGEKAVAFYKKLGFLKVPGKVKDYWRPSVTTHKKMLVAGESKRDALLLAEIAYGEDTKQERSAFLAKLDAVAKGD